MLEESIENAKNYNLISILFWKESKEEEKAVEEVVDILPVDSGYGVEQKVEISENNEFPVTWN